jgi:dTMP kinase
MTRGPLFIVFEGIDGSGKSTQCDLLFGHASAMGLQAVRLAEPTDGAWGRAIRSILRKADMPPADEQLRLFMLDREDDVKRNILPALKEKKIIIMDRYYYSTVAYQGAAGMTPERIIAENRAMRFPEPDRVYFIDIPPETAILRVTGRGNKTKEIFEKEYFLKKVRGIFLSIADERFLIIDGTKKIEDIFEIIKKDFMTLIF